MQWYSANDPVVLGQGVDISSSGLGTRNNFLNIDDSLIDQQQPVTRLESQDFSRTEDVVQNLKINAFASVSGFMYRGTFGFNYNKYFSSNVDERKWEVDALRTQTWILKKLPVFTPPTDMTSFRSIYGNYFVSAITYRRRLRVRFTSQVSQQVSEQDIRLAIGLSSKVFSASADLTDLSAQLQKIGSISVEIEIDGINGSTVLSVGGLGDLANLRDKVAALLLHFDDQQPGERPGVIDVVKLRHYSTLFAVPFDPFKTPLEDSLSLAIASYLRLEGLRTRLQDLRSRNYNVRLKNYLLSKSQEVETKRQTLVKYMQRLVLNQDSQVIPSPNTDVAFDDPEVIRWRWINTTISNNSQFFFFHMETYGETDVNVRAANATAISTTVDLNTRHPVTGIRTQRWTIQFWRLDSTTGDGIKGLETQKLDVQFVLNTQDGQQYFLASAPTNVRQLQIIVPWSRYR